MKELIEPCKSCFGCNRLENPEFEGDKKCKDFIRHKFIETDKETYQIFRKNLIDLSKGV